MLNFKVVSGCFEISIATVTLNSMKLMLKIERFVYNNLLVFILITTMLH